MNGLITRRSAFKTFALVGAASVFPRWLNPQAPLALADEPEPTPSEVELSVMAQSARLFMGRYQVPGLSTAIVRHGQFVYRGAFGIADQATGTSVTPSNLFRIASASKPITSVAIFSLVEKGRLHLNDLIFGSGSILGFDYGSVYPERVQRIRLEHLLTHTCGGWSNDADDPMFFDRKMAMSDLIKWTVRNVPLQYEPGEHYAYSNFGYCLLGRVIEKCSGQIYEQFVQQSVLTRCDVEDMRIAGNSIAERAPREVVYYGQKGADPYDMNVRRMDSHGGWIATPSDLVRVAMHVDGFSFTPSILEEATIQTMTAPCLISPLPHYAKGWFVNDWPNWWHTGVLSGTASIMVRTATGLCWAALANTYADGILPSLDRLMWDMVSAVPAWRAADLHGRT